MLKILIKKSIKNIILKNKVIIFGSKREVLGLKNKFRTMFNKIGILESKDFSILTENFINISFHRVEIIIFKINSLVKIKIILFIIKLKIKVMRMRT